MDGVSGLSIQHLKMIASNETPTHDSEISKQPLVCLFDASRKAFANQRTDSVSYVRGFSVSAVCTCAQTDGSQRISGCNQDLWATGKSCPNKGGQLNVTCPNTSKDKGPAQDWFSQCTHLAYTYRRYSTLKNLHDVILKG